MIDAREEAHEIFSWLQSAAYDYAEGTVMMEMPGPYDNDTHKNIDWDKVERLADDFYNDPASLRDLVGDRIYDAGSGDNKLMTAIAKALRDNFAHSALVQACNDIIKDHSN